MVKTARSGGEPNLSGRFLVLLVVTFLAFINYSLLLPVVPMWAAGGGAGSFAVGGTTGVMMAATVATQVGARWLFRVLSLRSMILLGALLLGLPTPLYALTDELGPILAITAVRGIGFALVVVSGATLVADLAGHRLATASGMYGAAAALPNLGALAGGVWLAQTVGFVTVFIIAAVATVIAAVAAIALPGANRGSFELGALTDMRIIAPPMALFLLSAAAFGAATTFLPVTDLDTGMVTLGLLSAAACLVLGRLGAGALGARIGSGRLLTSAVVAGGAGLILMAAALQGIGWRLPLGTALLGLGFGASQNDSFVVTVERLGHGRAGTASTLWNIGYDGGMGLGAVVIGGLIGLTGYAGAFVVVGVLMAIVAVLMGFTRLARRTRTDSPA